MTHLTFQKSAAKKIILALVLCTSASTTFAEATGRTVTVRDDALWTVKITPGDFRHGIGANGSADEIYGEMAESMNRADTATNRATKDQIQNALTTLQNSIAKTLFGLEDLSLSIALSQVEKAYMNYLAAMYDTTAVANENGQIEFLVSKTDSDLTKILKKSSADMIKGLKNKNYDESLKATVQDKSAQQIVISRIRLYQAYIRYSLPFAMAVSEIINLGPREDYIGYERLKVQKKKTASTKIFQASYNEFIKEWSEVRRDLLYDPYLVMVFGVDKQFNTDSLHFSHFTPELKKMIEDQKSFLATREINKKAYAFLNKWYESLNSTYNKTTNGYSVFIKNPISAYYYHTAPSEMMEFSLMPKIR